MVSVIGHQSGGKPCACTQFKDALGLDCAVVIDALKPVLLDGLRRR